MESSSQKSSTRSQRSSAPSQRSSAHGSFAKSQKSTRSQGSFAPSQKSSGQSKGSFARSQKSSVQSRGSFAQSQKASFQSQDSFPQSQKSSFESQGSFAQSQKSSVHSQKSAVLSQGSVAPSQKSSALTNNSAATMSGISLYESEQGIGESQRETPQGGKLSLTELSQTQSESGQYEEEEQHKELAESSNGQNGSVQNEENGSQMESLDRYEPDAWDTAIDEEEQNSSDNVGMYQGKGNEDHYNNEGKSLYEDSQTKLNHYGTDNSQDDIDVDEDEAEFGLNRTESVQAIVEYNTDETEKYSQEREKIDTAESEIDIPYSATTSKVMMANGQSEMLCDSESEEYSDSDGEDPGGDGNRALVSSATLGGQVPQEGASESALTRQEKMIILKRLMKEVTLEGTLAKYRGPINAHLESQANKSDPSLCSNVQIRKKQPGMEKGCIFLADREYMAKLESQLEKQYQTDMDKKEEERADLEKQRMRRLMVEGIIGPDEFKDDGHPKNRSHNSRSHRGNKKSRRSGSAWRSKSAPELKTRHQPPGPSTTRSHTAAPGAHACSSRRGSPTKQHTPRHTGSAFNGETQMSQMERDADGNERFQPRQARFRRCFVHDEEGCTCDSQSPERKETPLKHYQDPLIEKLKDDDMTVERMYTLADIILPTDRPKSYLEKPHTGKKKMTPAQERKRREMALAGVVRR